MKKFTTDSFLRLLLFSQLHEMESPHSSADCLLDENLQDGTNLESISISQLSHRLNRINPEIF